MPRRIALIVGVSQYEPRTGLRNLSAPVNDAQRVYEVLHQYGGFDTLYPLPLGIEGVDASGFVPSGELVERLTELLNPQAGDEVELAVIYFSGHGVSERGQVVYLSASDERLAVAVPWLADLAKSSAVKNVCLWLDCCHSGEVLKFADLGDKGFCVVAASHADGEALALDGRSLLTELLCKALTPGGDNGQEIHVLDFVQAIEAGRKNLPQQVLCRWGDTPFTLTQFHGETTVTSAYPPDYPPYKGLLTFTQVDREFFFGRDGMIQQLLDELSASRFVPLLGASGSGKSSLVLAGLLPKLPESDWQVLVMRPTAQPLQNLRDTLVRGFPDAQVGTLASGADLQREVLRLVTVGKRLLLVIDQFEEVFTECRDDAARAAFFACLLEALDGDNPLHLVLTLRADFLGHCTEQAYSGLGQRLQHHALLLVAPTAGELREAITRPLALVGMRCEQALEDELVDQTLHAKGSLPLLQYVLEKLWQSARQERSRELTLTMYQQLGGQHGGGLRGVLNEKADAFYQQLEPQQQRLMEWLMVELTQVGDGQDDTRRIVTLQELHNRQPQYTAALDALLAQLVTHERLLTQDHDDHGQATVTVAHEALIRDWQRLRGWLESNREIKSWRLRLQDSISAWKNNVSGSLLREKRLAEAQQIIDRNPDSLLIGQDERAFIVASHKSEKERKRAKTQLMVLIMTLLFIGIFVTTWQWREAEQRTLEANYNLAKVFEEKVAQLIPDEVIRGEALADPMQIRAAWLYGLDAAVQVVPKGRQALLPATLGHLSAIREADLSTERKRIVLPNRSKFSELTYSPDGKVLATDSKNHTVHLWDGASGKQLHTLEGHTSTITKLAYSPDGKVLASGSWDKTIRLWDTATGKPLQTLEGHTSNVSTLAYSPDGKVLASGSGDKTVCLWDVASGKQLQILEGHTDTLLALAYSPDGKVLASGSMDNTVLLWDTATATPLQTLSGHTNWITALTYSSDSKVLASGSMDNTVKLWDAASGNFLQTLAGHTNSVSALAYSPDGKVIASGSGDRTVRLWDTATGKHLQTIKWHTREVSALAYSQDGKVLASVDDAVRLWDVTTDPLLTTLSGHKNLITALAYSTDGKVIASSSWDKTVRLWDAATGKPLHTLEGHTDNVNALAYSPDGKVIASGSGSLDHTVRLWDTATGTPLQTLSGHKDWITALAYSLDGKVLASSSRDHTVRLWDVASGKSLHTLEGHRGVVAALAYSPDGTMLVSGSWDKTIRLWNAATGKPLQTLGGHTGGVKALAYSPDGRLLASGSEDNTVRLWDAASSKLLQTLEGHTGGVWALAYSPDGKVLASGSEDNTVRLWDAVSGKHLRTIEGYTDDVNALAYSPDGKVLASSFNDNTVRLWRFDSPVFRLIYDFDPAVVSTALRFIWEMQRDELQIKQQPHPPTLFAEKGYHITWTDETHKLHPLLDMPNPDETKLGQVVRFLEEQCAYQRAEDKQACEDKQRQALNASTNP